MVKSTLRNQNIEQDHSSRVNPPDGQLYHCSALKGCKQSTSPRFTLLKHFRALLNTFKAQQSTAHHFQALQSTAPPPHYLRQPKHPQQQGATPENQKIDNNPFTLKEFIGVDPVLNIVLNCPSVFHVEPRNINSTNGGCK